MLLCQDLPDKERLHIFVEPDPHMVSSLQNARTTYEEAKRSLSASHHRSEHERSQLKTQMDIATTSLWSVTGKAKIGGILKELRRLLLEANASRTHAEAVDDAQQAAAQQLRRVQQEQQHELHVHAALLDYDQGQAKQRASEPAVAALPDPRASDTADSKNLAPLSKSRDRSAGAKLMQLEDDEVVFVGCSDGTSAGAAQLKVKSKAPTTIATQAKTPFPLPDYEAAALVDSDTEKEPSLRRPRRRLSSKRLAASPSPATATKSCTGLRHMQCTAACQQPCLVHFDLSQDECSRPVLPDTSPHADGSAEYRRSAKDSKRSAVQSSPSTASSDETSSSDDEDVDWEAAFRPAAKRARRGVKVVSNESSKTLLSSDSEDVELPGLQKTHRCDIRRLHCLRLPCKCETIPRPWSKDLDIRPPH